MSFSKRDTNAMKGIAILLMIVHHCFMAKSRYEGIDINFFPFNENRVVEFAMFGKACVGIFAFLSAYGMTQTFKSKFKDGKEITSRDSVNFSVSRYIKMWGGYFCIFVTCILITALVQPEKLEIYKGSEGLFNFVINLLGLSHIFKSDTLVGTWWYISFATLIIFLFPIFMRVYRKFGFILCILSIIIPRCLNVIPNDFTKWLLAVALGIYFSDKNLLVRLKEWIPFQKKWGEILKFLVMTGILLVLYKMRISDWQKNYSDIFESIIPVFLVCYCYNYVLNWKYLNKVLEFFGIHSMNIFLFHTFIRIKWMNMYEVAGPYAIAVVLCVFVPSLLVSIIIEFIKEKINYEKGILKIKDGVLKILQV